MYVKLQEEELTEIHIYKYLEQKQHFAIENILSQVIAHFRCRIKVKVL
jgi:hypothetical protein